MAQIVKRVTGVSLREYAEREIFKPLGMTRTHFHDDPGHIMKGRAVSYRSSGRGELQIADLQNFDKIGAGGLYSTIDDLAKWDESFYTQRLGGPEFQRLMHTRGVLTSGDTLEYAFGIQIGNHRGLRTVAHGGSMMGFKANMVRFPDQRFTVIETCNLASINPTELGYVVAEVYLGSKMGPKSNPPARSTTAANGEAPPSVTAADIAALVGEYYSEDLGVTYRVVEQDGKLIIDAPRVDFSSSPLAPAGNDTFRVGDGYYMVTFVRSAPAARATGFTIGAARAGGVRFTRVSR
jgi:hypothetical protein